MKLSTLEMSSDTLAGLALESTGWHNLRRRVKRAATSQTTSPRRRCALHAPLQAGPLLALFGSLQGLRGNLRQQHVALQLKPACMAALIIVQTVRVKGRCGLIPSSAALHARLEPCTAPSKQSGSTVLGLINCGKCPHLEGYVLAGL